MSVGRHGVEEEEEEERWREMAGEMKREREGGGRRRPGNSRNGASYANDDVTQYHPPRRGL